MAKAAVREHSSRAFRVSRKAIVWIGVSVVILLAVAWLGIGAVAASQLTLPKRVFDPALNPEKYGLQYEDFRFPARSDGLQIAAWYIPSEQNQKAIILVHGRDNSRTNGFGDEFVSFANTLHKAGFSVMMIDLRGHGESADARFTFGIKERQDILGAVDWLKARGYQAGTIGVLGYSLGGASVVGAASLEVAIGAIWIDSTYADIESVIKRNWQTESGLPQVFLYATEAMIRLLYGYDINASRPVDEIAKIAPRPIFVAHCQQDQMIPISNMDRLLAVAQNTQTWVISNCDILQVRKNVAPKEQNNHAYGYIVQPEVYGQKAIEFFNTGLK